MVGLGSKDDAWTMRSTRVIATDCDRGMASAERTQSLREQGAFGIVASEGDRGFVRGDRLGCSTSAGPGRGGAMAEVCGRPGCRSRYGVGRSRCSNYGWIMPHGRDPAQLTRVKDGRSWQIGDSSVVAWIAASTITGLTITSAIPPDRGPRFAVRMP